MTSKTILEPAMQMPLVFGLVGSSGSGKTTLAVKLIAHFAGQGLHVTTIKHAHAGFEIDHPGKDSMRHRQAGATSVIVSSPNRVAQIDELGDQDEPDLLDLLERIGKNIDLVLVEGFKRGPQPKFEVYRPDNGKPPLDPVRFNIHAQIAPGGAIDLDDVPAIAAKAMTIAVPIDALYPP